MRREKSGGTSLSAEAEEAQEQNFVFASSQGNTHTQMVDVCEDTELLDPK